jgi:hypothetical protein
MTINMVIVYGQTCFTPYKISSNTSNLRLSDGRYVAPCPQPTTFRKLRINVHYLLKNDGTGNFNETGDGGTSTNSNYTGYSYATALIDLANKLLNDNENRPVMPSELQTASQKTMFSYQLNGVFFDKNSSQYSNSSYYTILSTMASSYNQNTDACMNIYMIECNSSICAPSEHGGYTYGFGSSSFLMHGAIAKAKKNDLNVMATNLNHEMGHCLNLDHVICSRIADDDNIGDTPIAETVTLLGLNTSVCGWGGGTLNNVMASSSSLCTTI